MGMAKAKDQTRMRVITGRVPRSRVIRSEKSFSRIASFLWTARGQAGLTLMGLAQLLGVSASRLQYWESADRLPKLGDLARVSEALKVDPEGLFLLRLAAQVDREFRRGSPSIEELHRRVLFIVQTQAEAKLRRPRATN
jgi:transcriptional regulator with XRE-family HTH domain